MSFKHAPETKSSPALLASKEVKILYVDYSHVESAICNPQWNHLDASFLDATPTSQVKSYRTFTPADVVERDVLDYIRALREPAHGTIADYGILAQYDGYWGSVLAGVRLSVSKSVTFVWADSELSGDTIYVFVPTTSFVLSEIERTFEMPPPMRFIVTLMPSELSMKKTFILRDVALRELRGLVYTSFPKENVEAVVLPDLNISEDRFSERIGMALYENRVTLKVEVVMKLPEPLLTADEEVRFFGTEFVDPPRMLNRLDRYFQNLRRCISSGDLAAVYTTVVQSSGWGKSRFVEQLLHRYPGCYTCFRLPQRPASSFPKPGVWAIALSGYFEMTKDSPAVSERDKELFCIFYVSALVLSIGLCLEGVMDQLVSALQPLMGTEYSGAVESLTREVQAFTARGRRDPAPEGLEKRLRFSLLALGQLNSKSHGFGVVFLNVLRYLLEVPFPNTFTALKSYIRPDLIRWGITDAILDGEYTAVARFCRNNGFSRPTLNRVKSLLRDSDADADAVHIASGFIGALSSAVKRITDSHSLPGRELVILAFDEAALLAAADSVDVHGIVPFRYLRRTLFLLRQIPLVAVFIGTNLTIVNFYSHHMMVSDRLGVEGKILEPLVFLPGKDIWEDEEEVKIAPREMHAFLLEMSRVPREQCQKMFLEKFSCFGRPVWKLLGDDALEYALQKLGLEDDDPRDLNDVDFRVRWIAALAVCCVLEPSPSSSLAAILVKSFMATLMNIDFVDAPGLICTYVSEPILAAAAATALFTSSTSIRPNILEPAVSGLRRSLILGATNKAGLTELVVRILLMAARTRDEDPVFRPISLLDLVRKMLQPQIKTDIDCLGALLGPLEDFEGMTLNYIQFLQMNRRAAVQQVEGRLITARGLFVGLRRACAFSTIPNCEGLDAILPISISASRFGYVGVQVKYRARAGPMNPVEVFDDMKKVWEEDAEDDVSNPLNIFVQLGGSARRMTSRDFRLGDYELVSALDSPPVALYKRLVVRNGCPCTIFFLHVYSVDAFAGVACELTRDVLRSIISWGPDLVVMSAITAMNENLFYRRVLLYGTDTRASRFKTRTLNVVNEQYWPYLPRTPESDSE